MKILSTKQTQEADAYTISNEPIRSIDLMERAAVTCFAWITKRYDSNHSFTVFCGVGNNGGDGLVVARLLKQKNYKVTVFIVEFSKNYSEDFQINLSRLKEMGVIPKMLTEKKHSFHLVKNEVVIDAIFGSGLKRPVEGFVAKIVHQINKSLVKVISIDLPSGLFSEDNSTNNFKNIIEASTTLTFQQPKLVMMFPDYYQFVGDFEVLDIRLSHDYLKSVDTKNIFITRQIAQSILKRRKKFSHKGTYGHALIIAGSKGKMGASVLAAKSCLKSGVGLLSVHSPKIGLDVLQVAVPEAMVEVDEENEFISELKEIESYTSIAIGPGIGRGKQTQNILKLLIQNSVIPLILDADALNILSENKTWLSFLPKESILTPHPKEFERLVGKWDTSEERNNLQKQFSIKHHIYMVLKGAHTSISCPNGVVYFNSTGNPGMATAGSGDVLTGLIAGLVAQSYQPKDATILGVYLHGLAGDIAKENLGEYALLSSDIIGYLPKAYGWLQ